MKESRSYLVGISEINSKDTSLIKGAVMECLSDCTVKGGEFVPLHFGISAFDDDSRALFDIPEVRAWAEQLYIVCPFILAIVDSPTMKWLVPCIADIEIIERKKKATSWKMNPKTEEQFIAHVLHARDTVFKSIAKSEEEHVRLCAEHTQRYNSIWSA
jgi:hypothetical protein